MPKKGETLSEEVKERMRAGREAARKKREQTIAEAKADLEAGHKLSEEVEVPVDDSHVDGDLDAEVQDLRAGQEYLKEQLSGMTALLQKLAAAAMTQQEAVSDAPKPEPSRGLDAEPEPRMSRENETRSGESRENNTRAQELRYSPPEVLSTPPAPAGYKYRWVAEYVRGEYQDQNLDYRHAEGWRPVFRDELPNGFHVRQSEDNFVRRGGLLLMKIHEELIRQRRALIARRSKEQLEGANELQGMGTKGRELPVFEKDDSRTLEGREAMNFLTEASGG